MAHHLHQLVMMKHLRYNTTTTTFSLNYIDFSSEQIFESDTHSQSLDISIVMTNLETRQCFTNFPTKSSRCTLYEKLKIKVFHSVSVQFHKVQLIECPLTNLRLDETSFVLRTISIIHHRFT